MDAPLNCEDNLAQKNERPFVIYTTQMLSEDVIKLTSSAGAFFLRASYLEKISAEDLYNGNTFAHDLVDDLINAGFAYRAECDAVAYLSRAEHSEFLLRRKLRKKNHSEQICDKVIAYVKKRRWLDDERYANAFLRNRSICRKEGSTRLMLELKKRGVAKDIAENAVKEFFKDHPLDDVLQGAIQKLRKKGKNDEKLVQALLRLGFNYREIKRALADESYGISKN